MTIDEIIKKENGKKPSLFKKIAQTAGSILLSLSMVTGVVGLCNYSMRAEPSKYNGYEKIKVEQVFREHYGFRIY